MNLLGLLVTVVLVVAGIWLVDKIAEMRKTQDCYLSGRRNCTPIEAPPIHRELIGGAASGLLPKFAHARGTDARTRVRGTVSLAHNLATVTGASPEKPSARAPAGVRSMTRPRMNGPRSVIVTTTDFPFLRLVTCTLLPNGKRAMGGGQSVVVQPDATCGSCAVAWSNRLMRCHSVPSATVGGASRTPIGSDKQKVELEFQVQLPCLMANGKAAAAVRLLLCGETGVCRCNATRIGQRS